MSSTGEWVSDRAVFKDEGIWSCCLRVARFGQLNTCSMVMGVSSLQWLHEEGKRFDIRYECVRRV